MLNPPGFPDARLVESDLHGRTPQALSFPRALWVRSQGMNRSTALRLIAIALIAFGVYRALYLPGMLVDPNMALLAMIFLQAVFAVAAGVGVWLRASWAALAVVLLGASVVATALVELVLGLIAALRALLEAGTAVLLTILIVTFVRNGGGPSGTLDRG